MKTRLTKGMIVKSPALDCLLIITNVTDKKVVYTPQVPTGGIKTNKNTIRNYTTSARIANEWINNATWIIQD